MAPTVEIIQPEDHDVAPEHLESQDSVTIGNPFVGYAAGFLALIIALVFVMSGGSGDETTGEQSQATTTLAPRDGSAAIDGDAESDADLDDAHQAEPPARRNTVEGWRGGQSLIVVENPRFIYELDLATGRRTSWAPPELLVDADPLILGAEVVVIGESGAWIGQPFDSEWRFLAEADRVLPSSETGRMWLRSEITVSDSSAIEFPWIEMDRTGQVHRTLIRDRKVDGPSPEINLGFERVAFRLTKSDGNPWRVFSQNGYPMAVGLNDIVIAECTASGCKPIWYDPKTGKAKTGFFPDLARNIVELDSLLSPDGRFVTYQERPGLRVTIASVANGNEIQNECIWNETLVWSSGSKLLACTTPTGAQLIDVSENTVLGAVVTSPGKWTRMVFVPTEEITQSR